MLDLFRPIRITYYVLTFAGLAMAFLLSALFFSVDVRWTFVFWLFLYFVPCFYILLFIAQRKTMRVKAVLLEDCDVEAYVEIFEQFTKRRLFGNMRNFVYLSLAGGYFALGKDYDAMLAYARVGKIARNKLRWVYLFSCQKFLFSYQVNVLKDIVSAKQSLLNMQELLENPRWKEKQKQEYRRIFREYQGALAMKMGDYESSEAVFLESVQHAKDRWTKVSAKCVLATIYLHKGRREEAVQAFSYVAEHGGTSLVQKRAVENLEKLGEVAPKRQLRNPAAIFSKKEIRGFYAGCVAVVLFVLALLVMLIQSQPFGFAGDLETAYENSTLVHGEALGEILFQSDSDEVVTVLRRVEHAEKRYYLLVDFFSRREHGGAYVYRHLGGRSSIEGTIDFSREDAIEQFTRALSAKISEDHGRMEAVLQRRPLFGFANSEAVRRMSIDGQRIDYVVDLGLWAGYGRLFFWYIRDAEILYESERVPEEIEVLFEC